MQATQKGVPMWLSCSFQTTDPVLFITKKLVSETIKTWDELRKPPLYNFSPTGFPEYSKVKVVVLTN